jgi:hypothetical protein
MTQLDRRQFLILFGQSTLLMSCASLSKRTGPAAIRPQVLIPTAFDLRTVFHEEKYRKFGYLFVFNPYDKSFKKALIPLALSHSAAMDPLEPNVCWVFEKDGPYACRVNLATMEAMDKFAAKPGWQFSGHGVFSPDHSQLITTEYPVGHPADGRLIVRDRKTLAIVGEINSGGPLPHELKWDSHHEHLVVANCGRPPWLERADVGGRIAWIDWKTQKIVHSMPPTDPNYAVCHLSLTADDEVVVPPIDMLQKREAKYRELGKLWWNYEERLKVWPVEKPVDTFGTSVLFGDQTVPAFKEGRELQVQPRMRESLNVGFVNKFDTAAVSHDLGNMVTFWNFKTRNFLGSIDVPRPRGVVGLEDTGTFVVVSAQEKIYLVDAQSRSIREVVSVPLLKNNVHSSLRT